MNYRANENIAFKVNLIRYIFKHGIFTDTLSLSLTIVPVGNFLNGFTVKLKFSFTRAVATVNDH